MVVLCSLNEIFESILNMCWEVSNKDRCVLFVVGHELCGLFQVLVEKMGVPEVLNTCFSSVGDLLRM